MEDKLIFKRLYAPVAFDAQSGRMLPCTMIAMTLEQLVGKYVRLWGELSASNGAASKGHIDRLNTELAAVEKAITGAQSLGLINAGGRQDEERGRAPPQLRYSGE